jgi:hypothetical protein
MPFEDFLEEVRVADGAFDELCIVEHRPDISRTPAQ